MSRALLLLVVVAVLLGGVMAAAEEPTPVVLCRASLACLQQMVDDLRDYRQYLEDQLSLAKSLLTQANQTIARQAKELEALKAPPEKKVDQ